MQATSDQPRPLERSPFDSLAKLPWWALILAALGLLFIYLILSNSNYHDTFEFLRIGVITTLRITLIAFPIATVIGLFTGLARLSKNVVPFTIATIYVEVIRGIPLVVLMLMVAFAIVPIFVNVINSTGAWGFNMITGGFLGAFFNSLANFSIRSIPMELRAIFALALGYGAFEAEIFRAGIQSISK
jgi:polar amino acid transport system permease protein